MVAFGIDYKLPTVNEVIFSLLTVFGYLKKCKVESASNRRSKDLLKMYLINK
jgi:hypothetical protein